MGGEGTTWPWVVLFGLGAFHGINPGMGWLFAVALGMQERSGAAVWRALLPLALGHAVAIAVAIVVAVAVGAVLPLTSLQWIVAVLLVGLGGWRLVRHRHPRYGGLRVGLWQLALWSFLMATAHGAGLMVVPVLLADSASAESTAGEGSNDHDQASHHAARAWAGTTARNPLVALAATAVHAAGYLLVTALAGWLVYAKLGVLFLRRAWINFDLVWAVALIVTGVLTAML